MAEKCAKAFRILTDKVPKVHNIGVAFRGGADSVALLWLAKRTFRNVTALTLDVSKKLTAQECSDAAGRAREIATSLGVKHLVVPGELHEENMPLGSFVKKARQNNYKMLLDECQRHGIKMLLFGHNHDDCLETCLSLFKKAGTVDTFGQLTSYFFKASHPNIALLKPLVDCPRSDILCLCKEEGLQYEPDEEINSQSLRRKILDENQDLKTAMSAYMEDVLKIRGDIREKVLSAADRATFSKCAYFKIPRNYIESLPGPIRTRLINLLAQCVSGNYALMKMNSIRTAWQNLTSQGHQHVSVYKSVMFMNEGLVYIAKATTEMETCPISPGETVVFHYWKIEFKNDVTGLKQTLYIKPFGRKYKIPFRLKSITKKIHPIVRFSLPVIVNKQDKLVFFPHLEKSTDLQPFKVTFVPAFHYKQYGRILI